MTMEHIDEQVVPIRNLLERIVAREGRQAAAIEVAVDGETVFEHYEGSDAAGRPATVETLWDLASIGKVYTAATVTALVERGALTFSRPVAAILPDFTGEGRERITLRHL